AAADRSAKPRPTSIGRAADANRSRACSWTRALPQQQRVRAAPSDTHVIADPRGGAAVGAELLHREHEAFGEAHEIAGDAADEDGLLDAAARRILRVLALGEKPEALGPHHHLDALARREPRLRPRAQRESVRGAERRGISERDDLRVEDVGLA